MKLSSETWANLQKHPNIRIGAQADYPHIVSVNFSKKAFWDKNWDSVTTKARGLFVNKHNLDIVARSYNKFFNLGEMPETKPEALARTLQFPLRGYRKENGFLGIAGWDKETNSLFLTSKSSSSSDFSGWFKAIFYQQSPEFQATIAKLTHHMGVSVVFEVIDPINDPHIIEYPHPKLVVLDLIKNQEEYEVETTLWDTQKVLEGEWFSWSDFEEFLGKPNLFYGYDSLGTMEGLVLQDSAGFQFKAKSGFYSFWKAMRGMKDRILRDQINPPQQPRKHWELWDPEAEKFYNWCQQQTNQILAQNIIVLRKMYESR